MGSSRDYLGEMREKIEMLQIQLDCETKSLTKTMEILSEDKEKWDRELRDLRSKIKSIQKEVHEKEELLEERKREYEEVERDIKKRERENSQLEKSIQGEEKTLEGKKKHKTKEITRLQEELEKTLEKVKQLTEINDYTKRQQNTEIGILEDMGQKKLSDGLEALTIKLREKDLEYEDQFKNMNAKVRTQQEALWKIQEQITAYQLECDDWAKRNQKLIQQMEILEE